MEQWSKSTSFSSLQKIRCNSENYVPVVVLRLSTGSSTGRAESIPSTFVSQDPVRHDSARRPANTRSRRKRRQAQGELERDPNKTRNGNKKECMDEGTRRLVARLAGMVGGVRSRGTTSEEFSRAASSRTSAKSGIGTSIALLTHFPNDRHCEECKRSKITRSLCRRRTGEKVSSSGKVGHLIAADHKFSTRRVNRDTITEHAAVVQELSSLRKHYVYSLLRRPKLRSMLANQDAKWLLAEDAMAKPYLEQTNFVDLITADHKVLSNNCESRNNHRYAIVVQDLAPNGSRRIRPKQLLRKQKRVHGSL